MSKQTTDNKSHFFLDELDIDVEGPIIVMICRKWDVSAVTDRYISTDFVVSDGRGNTMHCTAKGNISHNFVDKLQEGTVYSIKGFTVQPNKDEYRIIKDNAYMIELDGSTSVRKSAAKVDGFVRHPFQLIDFDDLQPTCNKYLIDIVGYVTNVGKSTQQRTGSRTLDFYLTNQRGRSIRVTLWGNLGDDLLKKKKNPENAEIYAIILTSMNAKYYNNKLYLSSSSSTLIIDDKEIPALKEFKLAVSYVELTQEALSVHQHEPKDGTLEDLLQWGRNRKNDSATFHCQLAINNIRTKKGWNYLACGSDKCKKGLTRKNGKFWCDACNKPVDYPVARYRLEIDVSDETAHAVIVMFDETAEELVKCSAKALLEAEDESSDSHSVLPNAITNVINTTHIFELKAHTYYEHGTFESFTCGKIYPPQDSANQSCTPIGFGPLDATVGVGTLDTDIEKPLLKRLSKGPTISTPLKVSEGKKKKRYIVEDSDSEAIRVEEAQVDKLAGISGQKKKKSYIVEDSDSEDATGVQKVFGGQP